MLGFAYISGYLIVNTYLSSFGITGDAIQIFKSKYVYVGFLYVLFLSGITLVFALAKKGWDLKHMLQYPPPPRDWTEWIAARESKKEVTQQRPARPAQEAAGDKLIAKSFMLWVAAVAFMVIPLNIELTLFNSTSYKHHMVVQFALLSSVILYQITYYRVYRDDKWDRNSQRIFGLRGICVTLELAFAILLLWRTQWLHTFSYWYRQHWAYRALLLAVTAMTLVWLFRPIFLSGPERIAWEEDYGRAWTIDIFKRSRFWAFMFALGGFIAITAVKYWVRWWLIQNAGLLMAISVLGGVVILSLQANQRRDREGPTHEATTTERWVRWILRVTACATLYVFSTLGYAYAIYSHIPVQKEGGDYTTASVVRIVSDHQIFENMIVLSQDPSYLYAARVEEPNPPEKATDGELGQQLCGQDYRCDPKHWRDGLLEQCGPFRPRVLAINQKEIRTIEETVRVSFFGGCKDALGN